MTGPASYLYLMKKSEFTPWLSLQSSSETTAYSLVYWGFCKCIYLLCISLIICASLSSPPHSPNSNPQLSKPSTQPLPLKLHYCGPLITLPLPLSLSSCVCGDSEVAPRWSDDELYFDILFNTESYIHHAIYHFQLNDIITVFF